MLARNPRSVLHPGGRAPAVRLHPVHRQAHGRPDPGTKNPVGKLKDVRVDLPVGLSVNPQATPQCDLATFTSNALLCPPTRRSGESLITVRRRHAAGPPVPAQVYNLVPSTGNRPASASELARHATSSSKPTSTGTATTTRASRSTSRRPPLGGCEGLICKNRLVFDGTRRQRQLPHHPEHLPRPGPGGLRSTPTRPTCGPTRWRTPNPLRFPNGSAACRGAAAAGDHPKSCGSIPFNPAIGVDPGTNQIDSPAGRPRSS